MARHHWAKKWAPYKSGLEASVAASLKEQGIEFGYEQETLEYRKRVAKGVCDACGGNKTSQRRTYLPDFVVRSAGANNSYGTSIYIETKGHFSPADRAKMAAVKQEHPELDIRLIFGADNKLNKNNDKRYSDWASEHGFPYHIGKDFPSSWASGLQINRDGPSDGNGSKSKGRPRRKTGRR